MLKKLSINPNFLEYFSELSISIDCSKNKSLLVSNNNFCNIVNIENVINNQNNIEAIQKLSLTESVISCKYSPDNNYIIVNDYDYNLNVYKKDENKDEYTHYHTFNQDICKI